MFWRKKTPQAIVNGITLPKMRIVTLALDKFDVEIEMWDHRGWGSVRSSLMYHGPYKTEKAAELFIRDYLELRTTLEKDKRAQKEFEEAHPPREVPPYCYLS